MPVATFSSTTVLPAGLATRPKMVAVAFDWAYADGAKAPDNSVAPKAQTSARSMTVVLISFRLCNIWSPIILRKHEADSQ